MAITKAYLGSNSEDIQAGTIAVTVDSTGYTHIACFAKHETTPSSVITVSDNKGSGAYNMLTAESHGTDPIAGVIGWVKIGTPGTSHTVTASFDGGTASVDYRRIHVWGINAGTGEISVDAQATAEGSGTTPDAGSLVTSAATVSFMGVGEFAATTYVPSSGWTEDYDANSSFVASRADASSGTFDPFCTSSSMSWICCAASFKESSGTGPGSGSDSSPVGMSESSANLIRVNIVEETN